jgi:hypothetical protein
MLLQPAGRMLAAVSVNHAAEQGLHTLHMALLLLLLLLLLPLPLPLLLLLLLLQLQLLLPACASPASVGGRSTASSTKAGKPTMVLHRSLLAGGMLLAGATAGFAPRSSPMPPFTSCLRPNCEKHHPDCSGGRLRLLAPPLGTLCAHRTGQKMATPNAVCGSSCAHMLPVAGMRLAATRQGAPCGRAPRTWRNGHAGPCTATCARQTGVGDAERRALVKHC